MTGQKLVDELDRAGVQYELLPHSRTESAAAEAEALSVDPRDVAKTLVLTTPEGFVRAVLPATERLDLRKVRELLGTKEIELATEEQMAEAYPEFEVGAVPPIAGSRGDRVLVDLGLGKREWVVFDAGGHEQSVRVRSDDLVRIAGAQLADLCRD
ncbi:MAG: aminoacyl-tRNA deacylase [Gaiellaceae bacterium]